MRAAFSCISLFSLSLLASTNSLASAPMNNHVGKKGNVPASLPVADPHPYTSFVATLSAGAVQESAGETQTISTIRPRTLSTFIADNSTNVLAEGELFLGVQAPIYSRLTGQLGFAVASASSANLSGSIRNDSTQVNNFNYTYQIQHTHLAVKGLLLTDTSYALKPYINGSVGVSYNQTRNFTTTPTNGSAVPPPNFESLNTAPFTYNLGETVFTYAVGFGVQRAINQHWQAGLGYEFSNWGKSLLAPAYNLPCEEGLYLSHLYTNAILLSLTYLS